MTTDVLSRAGGLPRMKSVANNENQPPSVCYQEIIFGAISTRYGSAMGDCWLELHWPCYEVVTTGVSSR